ncbi:MAG: cation:proton antiporter [Pseudonocardiaceae bacterium]
MLLAGRYGFGWDWKAAQIGGIALSTTSLAVVDAVLVETGLNATRIGKLIMSSTFVTDLGTVLVLMWLGDQAHSHAVLPAFLLGLACARTFERHRATQQRFRVVAFALLTPFFFLRSGMNISLPLVIANFGLLGALLTIKLLLKSVAVYPLARRFARPHTGFTTLLMSTGLTFGTISATYGFTAGLITKAQFSVLVTVVVLSAVLPTAIAQRFYLPDVAAERHGSMEPAESLDTGGLQRHQS